MVQYSLILLLWWFSSYCDSNWNGNFKDLSSSIFSKTGLFLKIVIWRRRYRMTERSPNIAFHWYRQWLSLILMTSAESQIQDVGHYWTHHQQFLPPVHNVFFIFVIKMWNISTNYENITWIKSTSDFYRTDLFSFNKYTVVWKHPNRIIVLNQATQQKMCWIHL
jgi:hypothetical protein